MADRIKQYMVYVNGLLESEEELDWEDEMQKHLVQIAFFAHERFIHLVVTVLFALMTTMVFLYTFSNFSIQLLLLMILLKESNHIVFMVHTQLKAYI